MNILITGAAGFIGKNFIWNLKNIRDGKDRTRDIRIDDIYEYDLGSTAEELEQYCKKADFVFHLAGVNRPKDASEFMSGNHGASVELLECLKRAGNRCPVMLSSSMQATLTGRFEGSEYGKSKVAGEDAFFTYEEGTGAIVLVYRFPNVFGKWSRPNYNSAVATFCYNIARDLPIQVNDPSTELDLVYIDDLVAELLDTLEGKEHHCDFQGADITPNPEGRYCYVPTTYHATLGEIVSLLQMFHDMPITLTIPELPRDSFEKKLLSTYLSFLPPEKANYALETKQDDRGCFTEILHTASHGQVSVNVSKPGKTKGEHWHNSKWELFIVVSGHGMIRQRKLGTDEVLEFEVKGDCPQAVQMLPGYAHSITNLSDHEDLVTVMWANEVFDPEKPDTFREEV